MGPGRRETTATTAVIVLTVVGLATAGAWFLWSRCGLRGCPEVSILREYMPDEASSVVDSRGEELAMLYRVRRIVVELDELPDHVPAAFIAIEDRRFWEHDGVDWPRVAGAAWVNLRERTFAEGFSTITMQLARNVFPDRLPQNERTVSRKLAEMRVAMEIEERHGKAEILELYLNQIYFGRGAWGIEAAAHEYFGKPASELTLGEAALLAGLIRAPAYLDPRRHEARALGRRRVVLEAMVREGMITSAEAAEAAAEPLELARGRAPEAREHAPYFVEEVRRFLEEEFGDALYTGGYTVHTTLDRAVQAAAEEELLRRLAAIEAGQFGAFRHATFSPGAAEEGEAVAYLQGAIVVVDAETGDVLAMVGGREFDHSRFNRVTQARRQPGSAFKPFVFAAALGAGIPASSALRDEPLRRVLGDGSVWEPANYGGGYAGLVTMRDALVHSRNVATIRLAEQVGLDRVIDTATGMGLSGPIPRVPSVAIGAAETTLLDLTLAYAAFATLGRRPEPRLVTRVEDRKGRVVWEQEPRTSPVLDPAVAFIVTDMMRDVVDRGTGTAVRAVGFHGAAAGKTGTTNDATDVWFIGFTPRRVAGVWIGFDRPRPIVPGATGGALAAPVWGRVMLRTGGAGQTPWTPPPGVERRSIDPAGRVLGEGCAPAGPIMPTEPAAHPRAEYFLAGTAPIGSCGPSGHDSLWPDTSLAGEPWPDTLRPGESPDRDENRPWWRRLWRRPSTPRDTTTASDRRDIAPATPTDNEPKSPAPSTPPTPSPIDTAPSPRPNPNRAPDAAPDSSPSTSPPPRLRGRPVQEPDR